MSRRSTSLVAFLVFGTALPAPAQTILWSSEANALNLTSSGAPMDAGFRFELGVFSAGFTPSSGNMASWAANWHAARRISYDSSNKRYAASHTPSDNTPPFSIGRPAYVWGFRGAPGGGEWILFRASTWTWPDAFGFTYSEWYAKDATPVVGGIHGTGTPFLMQSAPVSDAAPPATTWDQWRAAELAGEPFDRPGDDPDHDGSSNLLEFVMGTSPTSANAPVATPVELVSGHMRITIPRRIDHPASLVVEVSGDLLQWQSGPAHTEVLSDGLLALEVGDLTPVDSSNPRRFMRLRVSLP